MHLTSIFRPHKWAKLIVDQGLADWLKDEAFLKLRFYGEMGQLLDLKGPTTFSQKQQWLKLHNRNPEYTRLVDKYQVRQYIADTIGPEYLIPMLGVWDDPDEIDFDKLPDQFVLKCNHNSGRGMCICKDKSNLDFDKVRRDLRRGLQQDYYKIGREWPYKDVPRKIICEQYMEDRETKELRDYKFFCFDGNAETVMVATERESGDPKFYFFSDQWELLRLNLRGQNAPEDFTLPKPEKLDEMFKIASALSKEFPFLRVDLYHCNGRIYFGELTLFPQSGFDANLLRSTDEYFGKLVDLNKAYDMRNRE